MTRRALCIATTTFAVCFAATTSRAGTKKTDFPCAGCITTFPDATDAGRAPLLVVLHGDGGSPASILAVWEKEATARGIVVFAPKCPVDDGCPKQSWWQWGKSPTWFDARVDAIDAVRAIDRDRVWAAGWSGGGSYLGYRAPDLVGRFAAVSIEGGGMSPRDPAECASTCTLDSYFLVGDENPLHELAKDLRSWFDQCKEGALTWDLLPGADHGGEWLALSKPKKTAEILDWFATRRLTCAVASAPIASASIASASIASASIASASIAAAPSTSTTATPTASAAQIDPPLRATRCACSTPGDRSSSSPGALFAFALAFLTGRARRSSADCRTPCTSCRSGTRASRRRARCTSRFRSRADRRRWCP